LPELDPATVGRNEIARRFLAAFWVAWAIWLVARPVQLDDSTVSADARKQLAIFGFALLFVIAYGLFREWRWPVVASRALVAALILGVIIGPHGRQAWIYAIDVAFAAAGFVAAFGVIKMGVAPPPRRSSETMQRRVERKQEQLRRYKR
jgi:hypothetical protein